MGKGLKTMKGLKNKLKYIFYPPGWQPKELGGPLPIPEVDLKNDRKYDRQTSGAFSLYVLIQYIIILAGTALFLFNADKFNIWEQVLAVSLIILGVTSAGVILEEKKYSFSLEIIRIVATPIVIAFILIPNASPLLNSLVFGYGLLSFASIIFIRKSFTTVTNATSKTIS
jgi:hypothetical protein